MIFFSLKIFLLTCKTRAEKCLSGTFIAGTHHLSLSLCLKYFLLTFPSVKLLIILKDTENIPFSVKHSQFSLRWSHFCSSQIHASFSQSICHIPMELCWTTFAFQLNSKFSKVHWILFTSGITIGNVLRT